MSHASSAPLAIQTCIFSRSGLRLSELEHNSMTNSGHGTGVSASGGGGVQRSCEIHAASGQRTEPSRSWQPAFESSTEPLPSASAQFPSIGMMYEMRKLAPPRVGVITISSPLAARSMRRPGFSALKRQNASSDSGSSRLMRIGGSIPWNAMLMAIVYSAETQQTAR